MRTGYQLIAGDLVYSRIDARNGAFAIVPPELNGAVVSKDFPCFFIKRDQINASYLIRFLSSSQFYQQLRSASFGTTNRQRIGEDIFLKYRIPLPPLNEQLRLVAIMNEGEGLRRLRNSADVRTREAVPSLFDEMFLKAGGKGAEWPRFKVRDAVSLTNGRAFGPADWGQSGLPIVRIQNLKDSSAPFNFYSGPVEDKFLVEPGTILISWAGQLVSFGVHIWTGPKGVLNQHIFKAEPKMNFEVEYLREALHKVVEGAKASFQGSEMKHLTKGTLEDATISYPPLSLQKRFAAFVTNIRDLSSVQAASGQQLDRLFDSLVFGAFQGTL